MESIKILSAILKSDLFKLTKYSSSGEIYSVDLSTSTNNFHCYPHNYEKC